MFLMMLNSITTKLMANNYDLKKTNHYNKIRRKILAKCLFRNYLIAVGEYNLWLWAKKLEKELNWE